MAKRLTLGDWLKAHQGATGGPAAWITTIPEFDECVAAWKAGVHGGRILAWLQDPVEGPGYEDATPARVEWLRVNVKRDKET